MVNGVGLWHGSDGEKWAVVPTQGITQDILSQIDLRGPQSLQLRKVHLRIQQIIVVRFDQYYFLVFPNNYFDYADCQICTTIGFY